MPREHKPQKPFRLKRWRLDTNAGSAHFFTCARPGRSDDEESAWEQVPDELVHGWVEGLQKLGTKTAIILLLGRKPDGRSEFWFYSFCGGCDTSTERGNSLTFEEWLDHHHKDLNILVREHPTNDWGRICAETLDAVKADIEGLISMGRTVIVVDSGGVTRTGMVCSHMGAKEDSSRKA